MEFLIDAAPLLAIDHNRVAAELLNTFEQDRTGAHRSAPGATPFYSRGRTCTLETTALVVRSLAATQLEDQDRKFADKALMFLLESQDAEGSWFSEHATVHFLKALLPVASSQPHSEFGQ